MSSSTAATAGAASPRSPSGGRSPSSFLYNGTRRLYERLGFTYVRPKGLKNCVMSIEVPPAR